MQERSTNKRIWSAVKCEANTCSALQQLILLIFIYCRTVGIHLQLDGVHKYRVLSLRPIIRVHRHSCYTASKALLLQMARPQLENAQSSSGSAWQIAVQGWRAGQPLSRPPASRRAGWPPRAPGRNGSAEVGAVPRARPAPHRSECSAPGGAEPTPQPGRAGGRGSGAGRGPGRARRPLPAGCRSPRLPRPRNVLSPEPFRPPGGEKGRGRGGESRRKWRRPAEAPAWGRRCAGFIPRRRRLVGPGHVPAELPPPDASVRGRRLPEPSLRRGPRATLPAGLREPPPHAALRPPAWALRQRPLAPRPRFPRRRRAVREPVAGGADPAQAAERQPPVPGSLRRQIPGWSCPAPAAAQALARGLPEALPGMGQGGKGERPAPPHSEAGAGGREGGRAGVAAAAATRGPSARRGEHATPRLVTRRSIHPLRQDFEGRARLAPHWATSGFPTGRESGETPAQGAVWSGKGGGPRAWLRPVVKTQGLARVELSSFSYSGVWR